MGIARSILEPAPPADAASLYPLTPREGQISLRVGNRRAKTHHYTLDKTGENDQWRFFLEDLRATHLQQTSDGAIHITREYEYSEGVWMTYDPPIVLLPAIVAMDRPIEQRTRMTVYSLADGSPKDEGWCTYQIELLGSRTVNTPVGRKKGYVLRTRRHIKLRLADVQVISEATYAPDVGWHRERIDRITKPLLLFEVRQTELLRLLD